MTDTPVRVAYLTSRYPSLSHSFILREVMALRRRGVEVATVSVRQTPAADVLGPDDRREADSTHVLLPAGAATLARAVGALAVRNPAGLVRTAAEAVRRGLRRGPRHGLWQAFYVGEAVLMWDFCRRSGIRHVHAHFANVGADVAMLTARLGGPGWTWSFTMHGPTEFFDVPGHDLATKAAEAEGVACISDFCRSQLMKLLPRDRWDRLRVVHCGVQPAVYAPPAARPAHDGLNVLCVGRLVPDKGQALLVEAVALLGAGGRDVRLTLVGDGPDREALTRLAHQLGVAERVTFAGAVGQDRIREHYAAADVFCLPSFAEGVPVVLMEAMAMELPVVTTRIAGIGELVEDGVSGLLVRPGRADLLAEALTSLSDPAVRLRMGRAGRGTVCREFDVDAAAGDLAAMFADMAGART